jgi:broad specificity phosphatase PhoE
MRTTIYLVRHGDVYNPQQVLYERLPGFPLSDLGRTQAHALGKFLSTKSLRALYASPLERTQETARIISSYHRDLTVIPEERIIEVSTPARGRKMEELARENWNFYKKEHIEAGGERLSDIWRRMRHMFAEVRKKHAGQEIALVSHGDPIMISQLKHRGHRLSMRAIRGNEYVPTAKGFAFVFDSFGAVEVSKLEF